MSKGSVTPELIKKRYKQARLANAKWMTEGREDLRFALGEQWKKADREALEAQGRPVLTFNIIHPLVMLASGYQRQTRSSIRAFPEGAEDRIKSDIATALIKKVSQRSKVENCLSLRFTEGIMVGKAFLEPYLDYSENLVHGTLRFRGRNPFMVKIDPNSVEYDFSDAAYVIIEDFYSRSKLVSMFPQHKSKINAIEPSGEPLETDHPILGEIGDLGIPRTSESEESTYDNVFNMDETAPGTDEDEEGDEKLHYIEYWYKKDITQYLAVDAVRGQMQVFPDKQAAEAFLMGLQAADPITPEMVALMQAQDPQFTGQENTKVIPRTITQIWVAFMIEDEVIDDIVSPHYPQWKGYSLIPFFALYTPLARSELQRDDLAYQGLVRSLKDPQREKNKRRSQMLHHLNSSANSGWISVKGAWVNPQDVEDFGSTPGVNLEFHEGKDKPERITPVPLSQGHLVMEEAAENDIKTISGINADMLAMDDKTVSGRAIALRQQQGMVILKPVFDNFSWTQEIVGKFILTQLGKLFSVESAAKVLGEEFVIKNQVTPELISDVLTNADLGLYDIAIGEGQESPTTRYANYTMLTELLEKGFPIPPDVVIEYSDLPEGARRQVLAYMQQQRAMAQAAAGAVV